MKIKNHSLKRDAVKVIEFLEKFLMQLLLDLIKNLAKHPARRTNAVSRSTPHNFFVNHSIEFMKMKCDIGYIRNIVIIIKLICTNPVIDDFAATKMFNEI